MRGRNNTLYVQVGRRIRATRVGAGWTQRRLADAFGCSYNKIYNIEIGKVSVSLSDLIEIARLLQVSPLFLLQDVIDLGQIDTVREMLSTQRAQLETELAALQARLSTVNEQMARIGD